MKRYLRMFAFVLALSAGTQAHAGIPVIDGANLINSIMQVIAWIEQAENMIQQIDQFKDQIQQAETTYKSVSGIRNMGDLVNTPALRSYLPSDWNQALNLANSASNSASSLSGRVNDIKSASRILGVSDLGLDQNSDLAKLFSASQNQVATNRAMSEASYNAASARIGSIQTLLDKVNDAPDEKDILDLQARIQAEQAMLQNENAKLASLAQVQQAQKDIQDQQSREISIKAALNTAGAPRF